MSYITIKDLPEIQTIDLSGNEYIMVTDETSSVTSKFSVDSMVVYVGEHFDNTVDGKLELKVDKITGKGLSTEDFSTMEKNKLSSLENYVHPESGIPAGEYTKLTIDSLGHATAGSNPDTLLGYGITDAINSSNLGQPGGVATLDENGVINLSQIPVNILEYNTTTSFPITGEYNKIYISLDTNKLYRWTGVIYTQLGSLVNSVAGRTGSIILSKADVYLTNVDNTADINKNVFSATKLTTARTINNVSFDGTSNIIIEANDPNKVTSNASILGGTNTKLTYDSKGLVTAGTSLSSSDIPNLSADKITSGIISADRLPSYIANVQEALDSKVDDNEKGSANGVATLDANGKVTLTQIPDSVLGQLEYQGVWDFTTLPTATQKGQYWIASVAGNGYLVGDWAVWNELSFDKVDNTDAVASVAGRTGNVVLTKTDVGLSNVDNIADVSKNVLSATKLTTTRNIALTGDVTGSVNFDGSGNVSIDTTVSANSVALGTDTTGNYVAGNTAGTGITVTGPAGEGWSPTISIDSTVATLTGTQTLTNKTLQDSTTFIVNNIDATKKVQFDVAGVTTATTRTMTVPNVNGTLVTTGDTGSVTSTMILDGTIVNADINASAGIVDTKLATISTVGKVSNSATTATSLNTASAIVARDASGNFSAGSITYSDTINAKLPSVVNSITGLGKGAGASIKTQTNQLVASTVNYAPIIHSSTVINGVGYIQQASLGLFRDSSAASWNNAGFYMALGGNDGSPTTAFRFLYDGAGGTINSTGGSINLTGNATTASTLQTGRTIGMTGDVTWTSASFNGAENVTGVSTLATITDSGAGSFKKITTNSKGLVTGTVSVTQADITGLLGVGSISNTMLANGAVANLSGTNTGDETLATIKTKLGITTLSGSNTGDQTITLIGDVTGTGTGSFSATLSNSGVTSGTYSKVTVDAKGRVTAGSIPTMEDIPDATFKRSVKVATTANITLSAPQTIDGIAVVAGDRVLVKNQTTTSQNGIYVVNAGAWTRVLDANTSSKISSALVAVDSGTINGGKLFDNDFKTTDTLGTTAMLWNMNLDDGSLLTSGSTSIGMVKYNGTTAVAGQFDGGATTPTGTVRLNYGGYFYPSYLNLLGTADSAAASSHVYVETASDGYVRPKTLANFKTEMFASPTLVTPNIGVATGTSFNSITGLASVAPLIAGTAAVGTSTLTARQDHVHPTQTTVSGNAGTATALQTARTINGVSFNGTANITIPAATINIITTEFLNGYSRGGLPIYGIEVNIGLMPNATVKNVAFTFNIAYTYWIDNQNSYCANSTASYPLNYAGNVGESISCFLDRTNNLIKIFTSDDKSTFNGKLLILYTK